MYCAGMLTVGMVGVEGQSVSTTRFVYRNYINYHIHRKMTQRTETIAFTERGLVIWCTIAIPAHIAFNQTIVSPGETFSLSTDPSEKLRNSKLPRVVCLGVFPG